jgi:heat shock protein HtpX
MGNTFSNTLKTFALLATLGAILVAVGWLLGGSQLAVIAFVFALVMNGFVYWKSDTLALKANGARELGPEEEPRLRQIVSTLASRAGIPMPRLYIVDKPEPNAFATGRDPQHSAVAVTTGILQLMDDRELSGVLAHELSHVKNRDTLVGTIAATVAGAVSFLAQMAQFQMWFGGGDDEDRGNIVGLLAAIILAPIAALIVQLAVSRGREYLADGSGATLTGDPEGLASALEKLEATHQPGILARMRGRGWGGRQQAPAPQPALNPAFAHLYIVSPLAGDASPRNELSGRGFSSLFSTHPPIAERVARLRAMRVNMLSRPIPRES